MTDTVKKLSEFSGLRPAAIEQMLFDIDKNQKALQQCEEHEFEMVPDSRPGIIASYQCKRCGGVISWNSFYWFDIGLKQGKASPSTGREEE